MGVFTPYAFFFLSLLGPIIWFYLWREKKHVLPVSSIIPWQNLSMGQAPESKAFRVDWQLILQILAIIFATLALARLYWLKTAPFNYQVIVIDNSASMSAVDKEGNLRLDTAKEKALEVIDQIDAQTRVAIVEMAGNAKVVQEFTDKKSLLKKQIKEVKSKEEGTNFQAAINLGRSFLQGYAGGKIYLITDGGQWLLENPELTNQLNVINVGQSLENIAITGLDSYQGLYADLKQTIYIRVVNFGSSTRKTSLTVSLDGKRLQRKTLKLLPNSHQNVPIKLHNKRGLLKVELGAKDALPSDNAAFLLLEKREPLPVLLVTPSDYMADDFARLAKATGRINYSRILPEEFDPALLPDYRLLIFHESAPTKHFPIDTLYSSAPSGHGLWHVIGQEIERPKVLDWDREHPTLKHLDFLDRLEIERAQDVRLPSWGNLLIGSPELPLSFWGEENGFKQLVFCFDVQPILFPSSQDVSGLILFLNSLDWLASSSYMGGRIKTGDPHVVASTSVLKEVIVTDPLGEKTFFEPNDTKVYYDKTNYIGLYRVYTKDVNGIENYYAFVANLLDDNEAKLVTVRAKEQANLQEEKGEMDLNIRKEPHELWRALLLCAMLCLLAEWWLYLKE